MAGNDRGSGARCVPVRCSLAGACARESQIAAGSLVYRFSLPAPIHQLVLGEYDATSLQSTRELPIQLLLIPVAVKEIQRPAVLLRLPGSIRGDQV